MDLGVSANILALLALKSSLVNPADPSVVTGVNFMRRRHRGMWNVVFCDAHVESLKPAALWDPRVDAVVRRWNRDHQPHRDYFTGLYSP
jgi:prepilin-type processing-associated H-X9-DG protein